MAHNLVDTPQYKEERVQRSKSHKSHDKKIEQIEEFKLHQIAERLYNDPNKVPQISSMTAAVMASVYNESKKKALHQYNHNMQLGLKQLQQNDAKQPLEESEIIDLHLRIFNQISLQMVNYIDSKANQSTVHQKQCTLYRELCEEIGHNTDITNIGTEIIQWVKDNTGNQRFYVMHVGNGYYTVKCGHSGKYWDVAGANDDKGCVLIQYSYHGGGNQQFQFVIIKNDKGIYGIKVRHSGKYLDVEHESCNKGAKVHQFHNECKYSNQKWYIKKC